MYTVVYSNYCISLPPLHSFIFSISTPEELGRIAVCLTGSIDEVSKQVNMTWVQPRVLDLSQVRIQLAIDDAICTVLYMHV